MTPLRRRRGVVHPLFVLTILSSAFLLFLVQPMVARMALPRLGGAPAVWNSAMLVYQALLLGGYGYAHWLGRLEPRLQGRVHLGVLLVAALWLPIGLGGLAPGAGVAPAFWVPWLFVLSIGPLFLRSRRNRRCCNVGSAWRGRDRIPTRCTPHPTSAVSRD